MTDIDNKSPTLAHVSADSLAITLQCYIEGLADSIRWNVALPVLIGQKELRKIATKCIILNGILFIGSLLLFQYLMHPLFLYMLSFLSKETDPDIKSKTSYVFSVTLQFTYFVLWVYPIYGLSFILNSLWYQEIADVSFELLDEGYKKRPNSQVSFARTLSKRIADDIFTLLLELLFSVQVAFLYVIPIIGPVFSFMCMCWLYALYCFEYRWIHRGKTIEERIDLIETRWAYFAGFGTPFTCITFFAPSFINSGLFAILFPIYIILANLANPSPGIEHAEVILVTEIGHLPRISIFKYVKQLTHKLIQRISKKELKSNKKN